MNILFKNNSIVCNKHHDCVVVFVENPSNEGICPFCFSELKLETFDKNNQEQQSTIKRLISELDELRSNVRS